MNDHPQSTVASHVSPDASSNGDSVSSARQTTGWQSIETAPQGPIEVDFTARVEGTPMRFRMGPMIKLRGAHDGETYETLACWSVVGDRPGQWWDVEAEEPFGWPADEWRPLTNDERAEAYDDA